MDILQAIISNNKLVAQSLERAEPALRRACGKIAERVRRGGKIFCLGSDSPVPAAYPSPEGMFVAVALPGDDAWLELQAAGATAADVVVAVDSNTGAAVLADGVRSARRKGLLTACISCDSASASALAAEYVVHLPIEAVCESVALKEAAAKQMALDALLTAVLENIGVIALQNDGAAAAVGLDESTLRAVENLMSQCPGLERESAVELIVKYGSVRKAAQAYKANV